MARTLLKVLLALILFGLFVPVAAEAQTSDSKTRYTLAQDQGGGCFQAQIDVISTATKKIVETTFENWCFNQPFPVLGRVTWARWPDYLKQKPGKVIQGGVGYYFWQVQ